MELVELIQTYPIQTLIIGFIIGAIGLREITVLIDWFKKRFVKTSVDNALEDNKQEQRLQRDESMISALMLKNEEQDTHIKDLDKKIQLLLDSDKAAIKAWITRYHHKLIEQGWVDDYSLDSIESRYEYYLEEHGNSFVGDLMEEIRALPHYPPEQNQK